MCGWRRCLLWDRCGERPADLPGDESRSVRSSNGSSRVLRAWPPRFGRGVHLVCSSMAGCPRVSLGVACCGVRNPGIGDPDDPGGDDVEGTLLKAHRRSLCHLMVTLGLAGAMPAAL